MKQVQPFLIMQCRTRKKHGRNLNELQDGLSCGRYEDVLRCRPVRCIRQHEPTNWKVLRPFKIRTNFDQYTITLCL